MAEETDIQDTQIDDQQQQPEQQPAATGEQPTLSPDKRKELHGIVSDMILNKEPEENIKLVIDHYTKKNIVPEHQITNTTLQDVRHISDLANTDPTVLSTPMGEVKQSETDPAFAASKKSNQDLLNKKISDLGTEWNEKPEDVSKVLTDFPTEKDENKLKSNLQLLKNNPTAYDRYKAVDANIKLLGSKSVHAANQYNQLQGDEQNPIWNLNHLSQNIEEQKNIINSTLEGSDRQKALTNLQSNRSSSFNAINPEIQDEFNKNEDLKGNLDVMQYAGLKTLRAFDPQKAELYESILKNTDSQKDYTADQKIGLEKIKQELLGIGRKNTADYLNENQDNLGSQYKTAQSVDEKNDIAGQFLNNKNILQGIEDDSKKDDARFPYMKDLEFERQAKELNGTPDMGLASYALNRFGRGVGSAISSIQNEETQLLGTDKDIAENQMQRLGETATDENKYYLPEKYKGEGSPFIYKFDKPLRDAANVIKNDKTMSDEMKNRNLIALVKANQDSVHTISNTEKYGKSANLFSKATLYRSAGMVGDLGSIAAQQIGMEGAGLPKLISNTLPMYLTSQNDFYKEALDKGIANPSQYALTHSAILMAAGMINPDINIAKRTLGINTEAGKAIAGVSESTWNDIVSKNKPLVNRIKNSLTGVAKEGAKIGAVYGAGTSIANDLANKGLFNQQMNSEDIVDHAVKATKDITLSSIALLGLHGITNFKTVSPEEKARVWDLGHNPKLSIEKIDDEITKGNLTTEVGEQKKAVIKNVAKLIDKVPVNDANGKPLTDKARADYLYNLIIKNKASEIKGDLPEGQTEKVSGIMDEADGLNGKILTNTIPKLSIELPENATAADLVQHEINTGKVQTPYKDLLAKDPSKISGVVGELADQIKSGNESKLLEDGYSQRTIDAIKKEGANSSINPRHDNIQLDKSLQTMDMGDMAGKPEDEAAKKHLDNVVSKGNIKPATDATDPAMQGETFDEFKNRVIPAFDKILKTEPEHTTIVTHSSVLKAMQVWDEMGRPDIDNLSEEQKQTFADKFNDSETHNGDLVTFKGDKGDIHVIRHGQTEDNAQNKFRSGNTNLTEKGIQQAKDSGKELKEITGGNVPKIITSDLPRAVHTSNLIMDEVKSKNKPSVIMPNENRPNKVITKEDTAQGKIENLEAERKTKLKEVSKPNVRLKTIDESETKLNRKTGKKLLGKSSDGEIKYDETYDDRHEDIKTKLASLKKLVNCIWT